MPPIPVAKITPPRSADDLGAAGVLPGELRRGHRELREPVGAPRLLRVEERRGSKRVDLAGHRDREVVRCRSG